MTIFLLILAFVAAAIGLLSLSQATAGVGIIAFACLLAIAARIAQASAHSSAPAGAISPVPSTLDTHRAPGMDLGPWLPTTKADRRIVLVAVVVAIATVLVTIYLNTNAL